MFLFYFLFECYKMYQPSYPSCWLGLQGTLNLLWGEEDGLKTLNVGMQAWSISFWLAIWDCYLVSLFMRILEQFSTSTPPYFLPLGVRVFLASKFMKLLLALVPGELIWPNQIEIFISSLIQCKVCNQLTCDRMVCEAMLLSTPMSGSNQVFFSDCPIMWFGEAEKCEPFSCSCLQSKPYWFVGLSHELPRLHHIFQNLTLKISADVVACVWNWCSILQFVWLILWQQLRVWAEHIIDLNCFYCICIAIRADTL